MWGASDLYVICMYIWIKVHWTEAICMCRVSQNKKTRLKIAKFENLGFPVASVSNFELCTLFWETRYTWTETYWTEAHEPNIYVYSVFELLSNSAGRIIKENILSEFSIEFNYVLES